jgi:hypothetical protein
MSLTENLKTLGLAISDPDLRVKLRNLRKDNHPDTSGGDFRNSDQNATYHAADQALAHMGADSEIGKQIQVLPTTSLTNSMVTLDIAVRERDALLAEVNKAKATTTAEEKAKSEISEAVKEQYSLGLFGGWTAAGISTAILLLDKPLGGLIEEIFKGNTQYAQIAKIALGLIIILGTALSLWSKYQETQRVRRFASILTDVGTQHLLYSHSYTIFEDGSTESTQEFTLASLTAAISEYSQISDRSSCETTAEAIIKKLEARNLISKTTTVSFSPRYSISRETLNSSDLHDFYRFESQGSMPARLKIFLRRNIRKIRSSIRKTD